MPPYKKVAEQYKKITGYCDQFWKQIKDRYPAEISCTVGCSNCCELQSVNYLEAFMIARHMNGRDFSRAGKTGCPFLTDSRCRIYGARPLICRTHGLLLKSKEFAGRVAITCPDNFTGIDLATVNDKYALDIDAVTASLARLNAAFCMVLGDLKKVKGRIALSDLASGSINRSWFVVDKS
jgi:uncharacterized protein